MRHGEQPSLHLTVPQILVLAGGTTLGVIVFCGLPVVAVIRSGFSLRPRFDRHHPAVRHIGRLGGWAAMQLATTQVLLIAILVLSNRVTGGEIAYEAAFRFFLLPHALLTLPILTALFPALSQADAPRRLVGLHPPRRPGAAGDPVLRGRGVGRADRARPPPGAARCWPDTCTTAAA